MILAFKDRNIDFEKPVKVYRNLHKKHLKFSIKQGNKVVAHACDFYLVDAELIVNEGGRQRVIKEKQKNVHAYAKGLLRYESDLNCFSHLLFYNPYVDKQFWSHIAGQRIPIHTCREIHFNKNNTLIKI